MRVADFHFDLPEELIAQHPPEVRGASRMLVLDRATGAVRDALFRELPEFLRAGDVLVLNDSRVIPARLLGRRVGQRTQAKSPQPSGVVEVLLTEQEAGYREQGTGQVWHALVRPAKKVQPGETLVFEADSEEVLRAEVLAAGEFGERTLRFAPVRDFYAALERIGHMPLPPYIRREQAAEPDSAEDRERYQTVYSQERGSAAAPTAGLHFTPEVLEAIAARGVEIRYVTLHVGLGTFQPVRVEDLKDIRLHAERYTLPEATAESLRRALRDGRRVIAVGTTTTRTLEHVAARSIGGELSHISGRCGAPAAEDWIERIQAHSGETSIFISPGHRFRVISGLLTNFHLPESTLVMLVSALAGSGGDAEEGRRMVLAAYAHAVRERYRFYSYGDCMLVV